MVRMSFTAIYFTFGIPGFIGEPGLGLERDKAGSVRFLFW
jgi:hypothetical protein